MAVNDLWRVVTQGRLQGQIVENVHWWKETVGFATNDAARTKLGQWGTGSWIFNCLPLQGPQFEWRMVSTQPFPSVGGPGVRLDVPITTFGAAAAACLPSEVALVVWYKGANGGRREQGRSYVPGIETGAYDVDSGLWTVAAVTLAQALADVRKIVLTEAGGGAGRMTPVITDSARAFVHQIMYTGVNEAPRAQRRRQIGKGQ